MRGNVCITAFFFGKNQKVPLFCLNEAPHK